MGVGAALQQIGGGLMSWGMQRKDQKAQAQQQQQAKIAEDKLFMERQAALARLQAPPEKVDQLYNEQLGKVQNVRRQWQVNPDGSGGSWIETGRDVVAPPPSVPKFETFRQGDEEVSAFVDPATGTIREVGRGNAFSPSQRRPGGSGGGGGEGGSDGAKGGGKASDWTIENGVRVNKLTGEEVPLQRVQQSLRETEESKARGQNAQTLIEKAEAAQQQLAILDRMSELQKQTRTGPLGQYTQPRWASESAQEYEAQATRLLGPTLRAMFGANPTEGERKSAAGALPSRDKDETVNQKLIDQMREQANRQIEAAKALKAGGPSGSSPAPAQQGAYKVGDIITEGGKRYRVVGGTPDDPEVEPL